MCCISWYQILSFLLKIKNLFPHNLRHRLPSSLSLNQFDSLCFIRLKMQTIKCGASHR